MSTIGLFLYFLCSFFLTVISYKQAIPWIKTYERVLFHISRSGLRVDDENILKAYISSEGKGTTVKMDVLSYDGYSKTQYSLTMRTDESYFQHRSNETLIVHNASSNHKETIEMPAHLGIRNHYIGEVTRPNSTKSYGLVRGLFFESPKVFNGEITIDGTRYYIESKHKYCHYQKLRNKIKCDLKDFNAIMYKATDLNLSMAYKDTCNDPRKKCRIQTDNFVQLLKAEIPVETSSENVRSAAELNVPRSCGIEVIIHNSVQLLFNNDHNFIISKIREYVDAASDIFRKQDFNQDGLPDRVRITPIRIRYLQSSAASRFIFSTEDITEKWSLGRYVENWLKNYVSQRKDSEPYRICSVIAFILQGSEPIPFTYSYDLRYMPKGSRLESETSVPTVCRDEPISRSAYNVGVMALSVNDVPLPDRVVVLGLVHIFGHIFGAKHDDDKKMQSFGCVPRDADETGNYLMHSIPADGSMPNHVQFSKCSLRAIYEVLKNVPEDCLEPERHVTCGNGYKDSWEECDCIGNPEIQCIPSVTLCCRYKDGIQRWVYDDECYRKMVNKPHADVKTQERCVNQTTHCCTEQCTTVKVRKRCTPSKSDWPDEIIPCLNITEGNCVGDSNGLCIPELNEMGGACAPERTCDFHGRCDSDVCMDHQGEKRLQRCYDCPDGDARCVVCCMDIREGICLPYYNIRTLDVKYDLSAPQNKLGLNVQKGTTCARDERTCDGNGKCVDMTTHLESSTMPYVKTDEDVATNANSEVKTLGTVSTDAPEHYLERTIIVSTTQKSETRVTSESKTSLPVISTSLDMHTDEETNVVTGTSAEMTTLVTAKSLITEQELGTTFVSTTIMDEKIENSDSTTLVSVTSRSQDMKTGDETIATRDSNTTTEQTKLETGNTLETETGLDITTSLSATEKEKTSATSEPTTQSKFETTNKELITVSSIPETLQTSKKLDSSGSTEGQKHAEIYQSTITPKTPNKTTENSTFPGTPVQKEITIEITDSTVHQLATPIVVEPRRNASMLIATDNAVMQITFRGEISFWNAVILAMYLVRDI